MAAQKETIWVIDDDDSIRWVLERALLAEQRRVQSFSRASEAWRALKNGARPDAILADIRMPELDGLRFLEHVRSIDGAPPVIIMTAYSDLDSTVAAFQTGAFDYLPKPFDVEHTRALVDRALATSRAQAASARPSGSERATRNPIDGTHSIETPAEEPSDDGNLQGALIGEAPAMQAVFRAIGRLARSNITVLIQGESGSGKELVARALHEHSTRAGGPLIAINTAAIPKDLLESELFGHEKGAFTGASQMRRGRFEQAHGGTLFLDEIGDMPFDLQTRLLRVLADGSFYRVGGQTPVKVDVRIITATHQNLVERVRDGRFREDLYHRLNVIRVDVPPLRARREDIPLLVRHFLTRIAAELGVEVKLPSADTMAVLAAHDWPGNVRQLENACRWMTVMAVGRDVLPDDLPPELCADLRVRNSPSGAASGDLTAGGLIHSGHGAGVSTNAATTSRDVTASISDRSESPRTLTDSHTAYRLIGDPPSPLHENPDSKWEQALDQRLTAFFAAGHSDALSVVGPIFERSLIRCALHRTHGHRSRAATLIGWGRNTLTRKIQELEIESPDDDIDHRERH
ncbi:MAG: sigma 54-interacting transcriptional regulator [Thioalkalivibrionaceae bacterium]